MLWNRNKRSVALDLKNKDDLSIFRKMAEKADIMIENFRPGTAGRLGVDYTAITQINPQRNLLSISGFGQTGPYAERGGFEPNCKRDVWTNVN